MSDSPDSKGPTVFKNESHPTAWHQTNSLARKWNTDTDESKSEWRGEPDDRGQEVGDTTPAGRKWFRNWVVDGEKTIKMQMEETVIS